MLSLAMSITMLSSVSAKEASIEYQWVWTDYAAKEYAAGDGTKESPYLIKDASQLALLAKNVNEKGEKDKYYELISDIDLSGHFWNPIGDVKRKLNVFYGGNYFYGVFAWYYVDADGKMVTGFQTISGTKYYFANSGLMQTGWFKINGEDYYAASSGVISAQWVKSGNNWYYVDANGKMVTGD